jgi:molybdopterin-guanine dinucleotide biosynthesis protein A
MSKVDLGKAVRPVVMAGGKSSRMGTDKAMLYFDGQKMIERTLCVLKEVFHLRPLIVTNTPELYEGLEADVVTDIIKDSGPLAGIHTALSLAGTPYIFVVACDMPLLSAPFIKVVLSELDDNDVVIPFESETKNHPLHAIYSARCLPYIEKCLNQKKQRIIAFFPDVKVKEVDVLKYESLRAEQSCINVNTPEELKQTLLANNGKL